jgi:hypothetical protein
VTFCGILLEPGRLPVLHQGISDRSEKIEIGCSSRRSTDNHLKFSQYSTPDKTMKNILATLGIATCLMSFVPMLTVQAQVNIPAPTKKLLRTLEVPANVSVATLSRDRKILVTAQAGSITVWNLATGSSRSYPLLDPQYATIAPDERTLITGSLGMDTKEASSGGSCSGLSCDWNQGSTSTKSQLGSAIQLWELSTGKGVGMLALSTRESITFGVFGYDRLDFSADGKTFFSHSKNERRQEMLGWDYPNWKRKSDAKSIYQSIKPSFIIDIARNGNGSKLDIFTID